MSAYFMPTSSTLHFTVTAVTDVPTALSFSVVPTTVKPNELYTIQGNLVRIDTNAGIEGAELYLYNSIGALMDLTTTGPGGAFTLNGVEGSEGAKTNVVEFEGMPGLLSVFSQVPINVGTQAVMDWMPLLLLGGIVGLAYLLSRK